MHTRIDLVLCHREEEEAEELTWEIINILARIEGLANRFDTGSELSRINAGAGRQAMPLSPELFSIIREALAWRERTSGYFDITIQSENHHPELYKAVEMDEDGESIFFHAPGLVLDLNGYLKGYALDRSVGFLRSAGVTDALLNFGNSSVGAVGNHPFGIGWAVDTEIGLSGIPALEDVFLTTSGRGEKNKFPVRNPQDRQLPDSGKSVSVITSSGTAGEALSTALYAAPEGEKGKITSHPECRGVYYS